MPTFLNASPVFGPVLSRRFGVSLGVNLMPGTGKICTFDCLYCENGFNDRRRTRDGYVTLDELAPVLERTLAGMAARGERLDEICFAGNGEPTASPVYPEAVGLARDLRDELLPSAKVSTLSNGTMADRPRVREALMTLDRNVLKLDTVDPHYIEVVDRPLLPYDVERQVETYASFEGNVVIQTIFMRGEWRGESLDNTDEAHLLPWLDAVGRIGPRAVTIYTVDRDTAAGGLRKAPREVLDDIASRVRSRGIPCTAAY